MSYHPTFQHRFEFLGFRLLLFFIRLLPYRMALWIGVVFGKIIWWIGLRKKVARKNFDLCFGEDYNKSKRDRILQESYENFCRSMVELALLPKISAKISKLVEFENFGILEKLTEQKSGALLVTGHFGSWEIFAAAIAITGIPIDVVVQPQNNQLIDNFVNKMRSANSVGIIGVGVASRGILKALKAGRMVALLSDQDAGQSGVITSFFGHPASIAPGAAVFALKTGCPVVSGYIVRNTDGFTHKGYVKKLILPEFSGDKEKDIIDLSQFFTSVIEEGIREHPEQYFWVHRKFKSTIGY